MADGKLVPPQGGSATAPPRTGKTPPVNLTEELWEIHQELMRVRSELHSLDNHLATIVKRLAVLMGQANRGV